MSDSWKVVPEGEPAGRERGSATTQAEAIELAREMLRRTAEARHLTLSGSFRAETVVRAVGDSDAGIVLVDSGEAARGETSAPSSPPVSSDDQPIPDLAHREALINRLATARREGRDDPEAAEALLRRAVERNRAALDRLSR